MNCRHCGRALEHVVLDLGHAPPSNAYLLPTALDNPEQTYPLRLYVCDECWLVQTLDCVKAEALFDADYAYFSSTSKSWVAHAKAFFDLAVKRFALNQNSFVLEIASNDGYMLQHFVKAGIPCLGIEPTEATAAVAEARGIPVRRVFFDKTLATQLMNEGHGADLIIANNVYAHVPDINGFTEGVKAALKPGGTVAIEFPHVLRMITEAQFDTVYHEHFSYLSLYTTKRIFERAGLRIFAAHALPTHGGSLRVLGCHAEDRRGAEASVNAVLAQESAAGLRGLPIYREFQSRADRIKNDLLLFLINKKHRGHKVAAYGAAAKGNTLLNYAGIKADLIAYVCDAAASKQGRYLPGSHIPILAPDVLPELRPDILLILPWNIADEVMAEQCILRDWGGRFAVAVPRMEFYDA